MAAEKRKPPMVARNVCFTLNAEEHKECKHIVYDSNTMEYMVYQEEIAPHTGRHHLQGFLQLKKNTSFKKIKELLGNRAHIEIMQATAQEAAAYCKKTESRCEGGIHYEVGKMRTTGQRGDLILLKDMIMDKKMKKADLLVDETVLSVAARHGRFVDELIAIRDEQEGKKALASTMLTTELRPWQQEILKTTKTKPSDREVVWITDETGNSGKSYLARYLVAREGATLMEPAPCRELAYLWSRSQSDLVVFDVSRTKAKTEDMKFDPLDGMFAFIEQAKNGIVQSTKYLGQTIYHVSPRVIIFSNAPPDLSKLSKDRWTLFQICSGDLTKSMLCGEETIVL